MYNIQEKIVLFCQLLYSLVIDKAIVKIYSQFRVVQMCETVVHRLDKRHDAQGIHGIPTF